MSTTTGSGTDTLLVKKSTVSSATEYPLQKVIAGTASGGSGTTLVDAGVLTQADNYWIGSTIEILSGTGAGTRKIITDSDQSSTNVTVSGGFGFTPDTTTRYQITAFNVVNVLLDQSADNIVAEFLCIIDNFDHDGDGIGDAETMTFPDGTKLQLGDFITIYFEDDSSGAETKLFKGKIEEYNARRNPKTGREELLIAGRNFASELMDSVSVGDEYTDVPRGTIVKDFITVKGYAYNLSGAYTSAGGFINNSVNRGALTVTKKFNGVYAWDIITEMAEEANFTAFVDPSLNIHFHERDYTDSGQEIAEGTDHIVKFEFPDTTKDVVNKVLIYGGVPTKAITGISKASSAIVTSNGHGYEIGDAITFDAVVGMEEINTLEGSITAADTNTFTVNINTSGFSTYGSGGVAKRQQVVGVAESIDSQEFYGSSAKPLVKEKIWYDDNIKTDAEAMEKADLLLAKYEFPTTRGTVTLSHETGGSIYDYPKYEVGKLIKLSFPRQQIDGLFMLLRKKVQQHPYWVTLEFAEFARGQEFQIQDILKELRKQRADQKSSDITTKVLGSNVKINVAITWKIEEREEDAFIYNHSTWNAQPLNDASGPWNTIASG